MYSLVGMAGLFVLPSQAKEINNKKPNIIYILADDLGYGDLGCFGQEKIETPNIDKLAEQGMRFTQNYAGSAVSAPSRCVTFTGLHTGHAYIRGNDEMGKRGDVWNHAAMLADSTLEGQRPMPAGTVTFPILLQQNGYATGCIGKWGLGYPGSESTPNKMGFDFFYGYNCQRQAHNYYPPFLYRNEAREYLPNQLLEPKTATDKGVDPYNEESYRKYTQEIYSPDRMYEEILQFVEKNRKKPFFLAWTTTLPHTPLQAPKRWVDYYVEKFGDEKPYWGKRGYPCRYPHATYAAMISYLDEQVGGLVKRLKELGLYDNTIIMFTSDNGPAINSGGIDSPWFDSARPFKSENGWGKTSLHEGGIRVPLIVVWKDKVKQASVSKHICASWDVFPTICEMAGIRSSIKTDGISFLPELLGKRQERHKYLYWEYPEGGGKKAIRMGKWKGLLVNVKKHGEKNFMLFDLEEDPCEQQDVSAQYPEIVAQMRLNMKEAHETPAVSLYDF